MHADGWKPIAGNNMLLKLFTTFLRIGLFTIGGGYVMIPMIQREVVERNGWISQEDFLDLLAISQAAPGVFAVNISIFIGYRMRKTAGSIVCATGTVIPSVAIILLIALFFQQVRDNPLIENIFKGIVEGKENVLVDENAPKPPVQTSMTDNGKPAMSGLEAAFYNMNPQIKH